MFEVVFENSDLIAVDKPSGWLTVPSRFESEDSRKVLGREIEKAKGLRLYPVHRLDFEVSGLVLFAITASGQKMANRWFENQSVQKTYHAISGPRDFAHWPENLRRADESISVGERQEWSCRILRGKRRSYEHPKGDPAVTLAELFRFENGEAHWRLSPKTGRAHQLRFEMSRHGFPIVGDSLYGSRAPWPGDNAIALRAVQLDFSNLPEEARGGLPATLQVKGLFE